VLLDISLRGGSGMEVLRHVNRDLPDVKVIMLSSHSEPEYREHFKDAGAYLFFDKAQEFDKVSDALIDLAIGRYINSIAHDPRS
jgi:two-component system, response regulator, stage 0 sporulation protein F